MGIHWEDVFGTLGTAAALTGLIAFLGKALIGHLLTKDIEANKAQLKQSSDAELARLTTQLKRDSDISLAKLTNELKASADYELEAIRNHFQTDLEEYKLKLASNASREERLRNEVLHWANPILGAVRDLKGRLHNILHQEAYFALDKDSADKIDANWSITYDYFRPSTCYLFVQYFCLMRLFEQKLSFEFFASQKEKDEFVSVLHKVSHALSACPPVYPGNGKDIQIFRLQQRAIGEAFIAEKDSGDLCVSYPRFLTRLKNSEDTVVLAPIFRLIESVRPHDRRWIRLEAVHNCLAKLEEHCLNVLVSATKV